MSDFIRRNFSLIQKDLKKELLDVTVKPADTKAKIVSGNAVTVYHKTSSANTLSVSGSSGASGSSGSSNSSGASGSSGSSNSSGASGVSGVSGSDGTMYTYEEKNNIVNNVINNFSSGNTTVYSACNDLLKIGITATVTTANNEHTLMFNGVDGRKVTVTCSKQAADDGTGGRVIETISKSDVDALILQYQNDFPDIQNFFKAAATVCGEICIYTINSENLPDEVKTPTLEGLKTYLNTPQKSEFQDELEKFVNKYNQETSIQSSHLAELKNLLNLYGIEYSEKKKNNVTTEVSFSAEIVVDGKKEVKVYILNFIKELDCYNKNYLQRLGFDEDTISKYFIMQSEKDFVMNEINIQADFAESEYGVIDTPVKLKSAVDRKYAKEMNDSVPATSSNRATRSGKVDTSNIQTYSENELPAQSNNPTKDGSCLCETDAQNIADVNSVQNSVFLSFTLQELTDSYKFTSDDISSFFTKEGDKYVIKESSAKSCFGKDIKTPDELLEAMKGDISINYIYGAYSLGSEKYLNYLIKNGEGYGSNVTFRINFEKLATDFPDEQIVTLGQLKETVDRKSAEAVNNVNETSAVTAYSIQELKDTYKLTTDDISSFFTKEGDKYVIKESTAKSCFGKDIKTPDELLEAMKGDISINLIYGVYFMGSEKYLNYLIKNGEGSGSNVTFRINFEKLATDFPDEQIVTLGQLKESVDRKSAEAVNNVNETSAVTSYSIQELKDTYKLTTDDIRVFLKKDDDGYVIKESSAKSCFGKDIKTPDELLEAMKGDISINHIYGCYYMGSEKYLNYLIKNGEGYGSNVTYKINFEKLLSDFPEENIVTLGQLKEFIDLISVTSEEKHAVLEEVKTAFMNGSSDWNFENLQPLEQQAEDLYNYLVSDNDIMRFDGLKNDFEILVKRKASEFVENIRQSLILYTNSELTEQYGLSDIQIYMFFTKTDSGEYRFSQEKIDDFYGVECQVNSIDKLNQFADSYVLQKQRMIKVCDYYTNALKEGASEFGFDKLYPKPTDTELDMFHEKLSLLNIFGNQSLNSFENTINKHIDEILNDVLFTRFENMIENNELNKKEKCSVVKTYIDKYLELSKNYLNCHNLISEDFVNSVFDFCVNKLDLQDSSRYNVNTILKTLSKNIKDLLFEKHDYTKISGNNMVFYLADRSLFPLTTDYKLLSLFSLYKQQGSNLNCLYAEFIGSQFEKINEMNFSYEEKKTVYRLLLKNLGCNQNSNGFFEGLTAEQFCSNSIEDIYNAINDIITNYHHMDITDIYASTFIDTSVLFKNDDSISAEELMYNFPELKLSNDPGVRKLTEIIEEAFGKFDCIFDFEKTDLINNLIKFINRKCGFGNSAELTAGAINKLNQSGIFDEIKNIINSNEFYVANMVNFDGVINYFSQGAMGDCWLLAALQALSSSKSGSNIIKSQITWTDDCSRVTVYFAGVNKYVTLTAEEIIEANISRGLSSGDDDVLIIELAMQKVYGDIYGGVEVTFWNYFVKNCSTSHVTPKGDPDKVRNCLQQLLDNKRNGKNFAASFALGWHCGGEYCPETNSQHYSWTCTDGTVGYFNLEYTDLGEGHGFAITDITATTVSFANPHNSSQVYTVTWEEFMNIGIYDFELAVF